MHVLCTSKKQNLLAFKGLSALFYSNLTFFLILGVLRCSIENDGEEFEFRKCPAYYLLRRLRHPSNDVRTTVSPSFDIASGARKNDLLANDFPPTDKCGTKPTAE
jgi:hypothetical protein